MSIVAALDKVLFFNASSKYSVLRMKTEDSSVPAEARSPYRYHDHLIRFTAVGIELPQTDTVKIEMDGEWKDGKYGLQLQVDHWQEIVPPTLEGVRNYLASGLLKGIGEKTADAIIEKFGINALEILEHQPDRLLEIRGITIADTSAALLNLESSDIDAYCDIQTSDYVLANANDNIKIVEGDALGYEFIEFNTAKAPFDNVKVRQAIAYAVDKDAMLLGVNDNIGTKIDSVVLKDALGYTDKIATYEYNLEKAKALLAEAGYPDGFTCDIHTPSALYAKYAQVLQESLRQIGVTANIKQEELSAYKASTIGGKFDIAINGCSFTFMDVYESCGDVIYGPKIGETNSTFYNDPDVNAWFAEALETGDQEKLASLYEKVLIKISEDLPIIPFIWRVRNITCAKDLNIPYVDPYAFHYLRDWSWNS